MKAQVILCAALLAGVTVVAQQPTQNQPKPGQASATQQSAPAGQAQAQPGAAAQPAGKPLPQAKTQEEFQAYQQAATKTDPAEAEAAADDFAAKFKDSEIRGVLYHRVLQLYQSANNAEKAIEIGRKILAINPNDPIANVMVATFIAERTRETDLDKDQRVAEAQKDAKKALETVDTEFMTAPGTPPERVEAAKAMIKSMAYAALGASEAANSNYAAAENYFKQAVSIPSAQPDAVMWLQYALVLDKAKKYPEALTIANKAFDASPAGSPVQNLVKQERERLLKLTGAPAPAPAATTTTPQQPQGPKQ